MSALGQNSTCASVQAMSALTPISDIGRHACYRCELGASARHKAANLGVAVTVVIGPHDGRAETVGFGYNCRVRVQQTIARSYPAPGRTNRLTPTQQISSGVAAIVPLLGHENTQPAATHAIFQSWIPLFREIHAVDLTSHAARHHDCRVVRRPFREACMFDD